MAEQTEPTKAELEHQLNLLFFECFSTPAGQQVLRNLKLAFMAVMPSTVTSEQLFYREGQRSVIGIIDHRIRGAQREPVETGSTSKSTSKRSARAHPSGHGPASSS